MKPSEVLDRGSEILIERGLAKCVYRDGNGRVCSSRALWDATSNAGHAGPERAELYRTSLHYLMVKVGGLVPLWNDEPERTLNEVVDALHDAALLAKENGQ